MRGISSVPSNDRARGALYGLAIGDAVGGACCGLAAFPPHAIAVVDSHGFGLEELADSLCALR
jgi:hypothetical protein